MENLLIIDLESTCFERGKEPRNFKSEIIEIGAVVLDSTTLQPIEEFQCFIKPVLFPMLSPFCKELTTITQEEVNQGLTIKQAIEQLKTFSEKHSNAVFCSWGHYDKGQFERVCKHFRVPYPFPNDNHISLKHAHSEFYKRPPMGMGSALRFHKIKLEGTHHRGIDDARNIAKIAVQMIRDGWTDTQLN